jgi:hypothetical protein
METLINDNDKPAENIQPLNDDPLKKLVQGYTQGMTVDNTQTSDPANVQPNASIPTVNGNPAPYGTYKSGPKAGQPRPIPTRLRQPNFNQPTTPQNTGVQQTQVFATQNNQPGSLPGSAVLTGAMMIFLVDLIIPTIIELLNNAISKKKIQGAALRMKDDQKKELAPYAEAAMRQLNIVSDPKWLLLFAIAGVYGTNYLKLKAEQ